MKSRLTIAMFFLGLFSGLIFHYQETKADPIAVPPPPSYYDGDHIYVTDTDTGFLAPSTIWYSIYNAGAATGTVEGVNVAPGVSITSPAFPCFARDTVNYDATGTTFIIFSIKR